MDKAELAKIKKILRLRINLSVLEIILQSYGIQGRRDKSGIIISEDDKVSKTGVFKFKFITQIKRKSMFVNLGLNGKLEAHLSEESIDKFIDTIGFTRDFIDGRKLFSLDVVQNIYDDFANQYLSDESKELESLLENQKFCNYIESDTTFPLVFNDEYTGIIFGLKDKFRRREAISDENVRRWLYFIEYDEHMDGYSEVTDVSSGIGLLLGYTVEQLQKTDIHDLHQFKKEIDRVKKITDAILILNSMK